ncbi:MAG: DNA-directed RNA polymerase subunit beta [Patescibacteria group bacterium]|nr:DNA-directed RNA polymerase subunit beta [Patescibacteria group bacterium]
MAPKKTSKAPEKVYANADRYSAAREFIYRRKESLGLPDLIEVQLNSYEWFLTDGLAALLSEVSPISDFQNEKLELSFSDHYIGTPKYDEEQAADKGVTYEAPLTVKAELLNKETGEISHQEVYVGGIPMMTDRGTFIVNGVERVIVNQLVRSSGVFFSRDLVLTDRYNFKLIPNRGAWIEVETDKGDTLSIKVDRKRKISVTAFLRALGYSTDKEIHDLFADVLDPERDFILNTLEKDTTSTTDEALQSVYKKLRPGDLATADNAKTLVNQMFFDYRHYDIGHVGRYKINQRIGVDRPETEENFVFNTEDFIEMVRELIRMNNTSGVAVSDDIDALDNRRVRSVGELVQNKFRVGLLRSERIVKDRMSTLDLEKLTAQQLINSHPINAALREFFSSSQLSQFMDQINPLAELAHKRRLSALGPGGLTRERASFEVRDVHTTHYGRVCPIETPEGPNIGLVVQLATFAKVNRYGFLETPFRTIKNTVPNKKEDLIERRFIHDFEVKGKVIAQKDTVIDEKLADTIVKIKDLTEVRVCPYVTEEVKYYDASYQKEMIQVPFSVETNEKGEFVERRVAARVAGEPAMEHIDNLTHMDVSSMQVFSTDTALIPFLEHDDNVRAAVGSNQQRQAVAVIRPEAPFVGTGLEHVAAKNSGQVVVSDNEAEVVYVDGQKIVTVTDSGDQFTYELRNFARTNQGTLLHQSPIVSEGQWVKEGQIMAQGPAIEGDELALGQNLLVAYMPFHGYNFEDAIVISENVARDGLFDSVHIEDHQIDLRDTKLGTEQFTRDIPNIGGDKLKDLNEEGFVRIGAEVGIGDILIGKITPKGETELTPEERLLRAIFGDKAADVKDTSLRINSGEKGKVISIREFTRRDGSDLPTGVLKRIVVSVAKIKRISIGDKMAGRHGNKGVISKIVPREDMPFMADGTPVDIVLNPLGVISRMNLGQILETHLGWVSKQKGVKIATPVLNGVSDTQIQEMYKELGSSEDGKLQLYDGYTGEAFEQTTTVGYKYMLKLSHIVEDKMHARSVGPYSLVTQQPLGGKAQRGGQRFGEMEVWALEAYGATHVLQEMLTIKSDDVHGRGKAYESIIKGENPENPSIPASFHVLVKELQACGLDVEFIADDGNVVDMNETAIDIIEEDSKAHLYKDKEEEKAVAEEFAALTEGTATLEE